MLYRLNKCLQTLVYVGCCLCVLTLSLAAKCISLQEALDRVEQENWSILLNREAVEQALQGQYMKRAGLFPQVKAEVSQARQKDSFRGANSSSYNTMQAGVTASVSLLDYSIYEAYRAAKQGYKVSKQAHKALLESILYETAKAYYAYARDLQRVAVLNKNLERDAALLALAEAQLRAGTASPLDRMRAHTRVLQDKQALLEQSLRLKTRELQLKQFLNLDPLEALAIDDSVLSTVIFADFPCSMEDLCRLRPDYKREQKKLKQLKTEVKQARSGHFPTLSVMGSAGLSGERLFNKNEQSTWMVGAKLSLPLFEGFRVSSDLLRAQAALRQQRYTMAELHHKILCDYTLARASLEALQEQIALSKDQVHLALEELEMAKARFQQGVADNQALLTAQAALAGVEDQALGLVYAYALACLDLAFEQGNTKMILKAHPL